MTTAPTTASDITQRLDITKPIIGGVTSHELFARLLGLGRAPSATPYRVTRVLWMPRRFELTVSGATAGSEAPGATADSDAAGDTVEVVLEGRDTYPETNDVPPLFSTAKLAIWYRHGELPIALQQRIARITPRWGDLAVPGLLALLLRDPEAERFVPAWEQAEIDGADAEIPPMDAAAEHEIRATLLGMWDSGSLFAEFFAADEFNAFPVEDIEISSPFVRIVHSDLECITLGDFDRPSAMTLVDFPWTDHLDPDDDLLARYMRSKTLLTDIDEDDVVMGCVAKLKGLLDRAPTDRDPTPVFFECSCLPATISEDVDGTVRRFSAQCGVPFAKTSRAHESSHIEAFRELLVERRLAAEQRAGAPDPQAVNLIGFPDGAPRDELTALLTDAGVRVNTAVLPELRPESIDRLPDARQHVMLRSSKWWDQLYDQLLEGTRIEHVTLDAPYGVAATRRWLEQVVDAAGLERAGLDAAWERRFATVEARWSALRARATGVAIGVVIRDEDLFLLEDPAHTLGIPLLAALHEMGFRTEILLRVGADDQETVVAKMLSHHPEPERATVARFETVAEMRACLAASEATAFIGNHTFDWRLSEAGKARIPLRTFRMGLSGALTSVERILSYCDVPYYATYGRHLRRSAMGRLPVVPIDRY